MTFSNRLRDAGRNAALAGLSLAIALALGELVLRHTVMPIQRPYHFEAGAVIADPELGYRLTPNHRSVMSDGYFSEEVVTTADGLRDAVDPALCDPGVLAIGDSYTFGHGIALADTWVEQLQARLHVNVVNAGVFGYGVTQYLPTLQRLAAAGHAPRLVLYAMSWNDVYSGEEPPDTSTVIDGYLQANPRYAAAPGTLSWRARLDSSWAFVYFTRFTAIGKALFTATAKLFAAAGISSDPGFDRTLDRKTEVTRQVVGRMRDWIESQGGRLAIVHIGDANFSIPEAWADFSRRHGVPRDYARRQFADWCASDRIAFADAIDDLQQYYVDHGQRRDSILLAVDPHFNAAGQGVIAEVFARLIDREDLLRDLTRTPSIDGNRRCGSSS